MSNSPAEPVPAGDSVAVASSETERAAGLSIDWWATITAGVIVALAVAGVLPRIPW